MGVGKRAQRELKSPQISETRGVRAGATGEYARFVRDNTQRGTIDAVRLSRINCKFKGLLELRRRRPTGQSSDLRITRKALVQGYRKLKCRGAWGESKTHFVSSRNFRASSSCLVMPCRAIAVARYKAGTCLILLPRSTLRRSFCTSGSAPTFKNSSYASGMGRVFSISACFTTMR